MNIIKEIKDNKNYMRYFDELLKPGSECKSGMSGGPLCTGCNKWLLKCSNKQIERYKNMMRKGSIFQFLYKRFLKKKYSK